MRKISSGRFAMPIKDKRSRMRAGAKRLAGHLSAPQGVGVELLKESRGIAR